MNSSAVQHELITYLPNLRAFAISLCGNSDLADDLVQDTVLKAWRYLDRFQEGTNLRAWLFTILRNVFFSHLRRGRPEVPIEVGAVKKFGVAPNQYGWMASRDFLKVLAQLSLEQREVIVLVGAEGFTYEAAAEVCGCAVGTIKSRLNRARARLHELLDKPPPGAISTQPSPLPAAKTQAWPVRRRAASGRRGRDLSPAIAEPRPA